MLSRLVMSAFKLRRILDALRRTAFVYNENIVNLFENNLS